MATQIVYVLFRLLHFSNLLNRKFLLILGSIIVGGSLIYLVASVQGKETNLYVEQIIAQCGDEPHCATEALLHLAESEEQITVLRTFDGIIAKYEEGGNYCHRQAHHLGMFLYTYNGNLTQSLLHADQKCGGAVYHGLMINYFLTQKDNSANPRTINITEICPKNSNNPYSLERWQCLHGLGHGLTASYDYDVLEAVKRCEEFQIRWEQLSCSKGVFMENVDQYYESGTGAFNEDNLFFPCNAVAAKYAPACYHYHASYLLAQTGSLIGTFEECDKIIPEEFVKYCYYGVGRQESISIFDEMERSLTVCQTGQPFYQTYCFSGMVMTLVNNRGTDQGFEFCKLLPHQFKAECYDGLGKWTLMLYNNIEGRTKECSKAESQDYFEVCMKASLEDLALL